MTSYFLLYNVTTATLHNYHHEPLAVLESYNYFRATPILYISRQRRKRHQSTTPNLATTKGISNNSGVLEGANHIVCSHCGQKLMFCQWRTIFSFESFEVCYRFIIEINTNRTSLFVERLSRGRLQGRIHRVSILASY